MFAGFWCGLGVVKVETKVDQSVVKVHQSGSEWVRVGQSGSGLVRVGQDMPEWVRAGHSTVQCSSLFCLLEACLQSNLAFKCFKH